MPVYVDNMNAMFADMIMSHMVADTVEELHAMAEKIGVAREHFQNQGSTPHYDICLAKKKLALRNGAIEIGRRDLAHMMRMWRRKGENASHNPAETPL